MRWLLTSTLGSDTFRNYVRWIASAGVSCDAVGSLRECPRSLRAYDALLLTGGADVNPRRYGAPPHPMTSGINDERDELETRLIRRFLALRKPVFGVCRGIQILNVALGGKLIQHLPDLPDSRRTKRLSEDHPFSFQFGSPGRFALPKPSILPGSGGARQPACLLAGPRRAAWTSESRRFRIGSNEEHRAPRQGGAALHGIRIADDSALGRALRDTREVNSAHHQAIDPDAVAPHLRVVACSPAGIIEAVEGIDLPSPVIAVQWHPERLPPTHPASVGVLGLMAGITPAARSGTGSSCRRGSDRPTAGRGGSRSGSRAP